MPAKKGGGPRKGQIGKKTQIEKMVESAKKTQSVPKTPQHSPVKQGSGTKKDDPKHYTTVNTASIPKQNNGLKKVKSFTIAATTRREPPELTPLQTATIRLPCQGSTTSPKTKLILYKQPLPLTTAVLKPSDRPHGVVIRLPPKRERTTFMSLPAEVRNVIYDYAMPRRKYRIQHIPRKDQRPTELTYSTIVNGRVGGPRLTAKEGIRRRDFDLGNPWQKDQISLPFRHPRGPAALLLVNKQINIDTTGILYGRNTFSFSAMRPMKKFLDSLRPETRSMVRNLEIIHHTAGDPVWTRDQIFKDRHDACWDSLCCQIRDQCNQLHSLAIDLTIKDIPFIMGPHANWMGPLYYFYDLEHLKHLRIRLHQFEVKDTVLEVEAYTIRKKLMTKDNYYEPSAASANGSPAEKASPAKVKTLRITGNVQTPARRPAPPRAVTFVPDPNYMPQHPFDPNGRAKINGTGPWRGSVLK